VTHSHIGTCQIGSGILQALHAWAKRFSDAALIAQTSTQTLKNIKLELKPEGSLLHSPSEDMTVKAAAGLDLHICVTVLWIFAALHCYSSLSETLGPRAGLR